MIEPGKDVKDIEISNDSSTDEIFNELKQSGGFESRNIAEGVEILSNMIQDEKCLKFLLPKKNFQVCQKSPVQSLPIIKHF